MEIVEVVVYLQMISSVNQSAESQQALPFTRFMTASIMCHIHATASAMAHTLSKDLPLLKM